MRRTLRIKNSPVAMFYSRINAFIIVLRVNFSLSDNFLLFLVFVLSFLFIHNISIRTFPLSLSLSLFLLSLTSYYYITNSYTVREK